jgi:7,8-dihydropterin-6-yl-methyl-4-(beta-D-ribofuranosyl)aminobenzene 5'-phosphate synthase
MKVEILNLYSNIPKPDSNLVGDHGQSFLIKYGNKQLLFDVGTSGKKLLHNMKELEVHPDDISLLVLSHGHYDHTGGLPEFIDARSNKEPLRIIAHPKIFAKRRIKIAFFGIPSKFPKLTEEQQAKVKFDFDTNPQELTDFILTS